MIQEVESHYANTRLEKLLELYCGAGFFTAPLAAKFEKVTACEENVDAIAYAKMHHGLKNVEWICSKVENYRFPDDIDAILVDPPRAGLRQKVIQRVLEKRPQMISYVSCDCTTFARDVKKLNPSYVLDRLTLLDLFPQTFHFEIIARMTRK
jgi:23S rRNA (uracil1939-C5)-methyltransferase